MVLWPPNNFESDAGETLSEQSHEQIFFPTTLMEPNNFQQATGEELQDAVDAMTLNEDVTINDYIFWSSTRDGMFNDVRRVTLGSLLAMLESESGPTTTSMGALITGATAKATPVDADMIPITDSAASNILKKVSWLNIKATIKAYTDTLYATTSHVHDYSTLTGIPSTFAPSSHTHAYGDLTGIPSTFAPSSHTHAYGDLTGIPSTFAPSSHTHISSEVGLGNVDNTSDTTKNAAAVTLTNKRITSRVTTITSSATPTINTDNCDAVTITALAAAITSMTTNLTGTPTNFQKLIIRIKDNGTTRAITWGASFEAKGVALPTTTVISKVLTVGFIYDTVTSKWGCVASAQEA